MNCTLFTPHYTTITLFYTLSLHDALPISWKSTFKMATDPNSPMTIDATYMLKDRRNGTAYVKVDGKMSSTNGLRSEEHTSEIQSLRHLVCSLLFEKKKKKLQ